MKNAPWNELALMGFSGSSSFIMNEYPVILYQRCCENATNDFHKCEIFSLTKLGKQDVEVTKCPVHPISVALMMNGYMGCKAVAPSKYQKTN